MPEAATYRRVECEECGLDFPSVQAFIDHLEEPK